MGLTHFSLFSGIGGIDIASEWAGFATIGQCEYADYPTKVLEKHWPDVPRWRDIRDVTLESVRARGIRTVDLISAGYPCQTFSVAGKRTGDLSLAEEFVRVVGELKPRWAVGENVGGHISNGLDEVLRMLGEKDYTARPFVLQAKAVGAPHKRERVFIVAYSNEARSEKCDISPKPIEQRFGSGLCNEKLANSGKESDGKACARCVQIGTKFHPRNNVSGSHWGTQPEPDWTVPKSELVRMADGLSNGLDALGCCGNAVVPGQIYPILQAIADIEKERTK